MLERFLRYPQVMLMLEETDMCTGEKGRTA